MSVDEKDEIQELKSSRALTKRQREGFVSFSAGSEDYSLGGILGAIFMISLISFSLFATVSVAGKAIMAESLLEKLGGVLFMSPFIIGLLWALYEPVLELYEEVKELIHSNTHLVLTRDYLEVYWSPLRILKQKILIKEIESIDIQWQRFFCGGTKVPIEGIKEKLNKDKHDVQGYSSFKVNLKNEKPKILNFKLREIAVAEQLGTYILSPQQFSTASPITSFGETVFETKEEKLEIYSSKRLLSKDKAEDYRGELKVLFKILGIFFLLIMMGQLSFLIMGLFIALEPIKKFLILLKNARIKKIEVTPSLLTESRIGLFSKPKNRAEFTKEEIDSFFVKGQENSKKYTISIILKKGVSHDLFIVFKERKTAEELIEKIKLVLANESRILIDSESNLSQMDLNTLEEGSDEALDSEKEDVG